MPKLKTEDANPPILSAVVVDSSPQRAIKLFIEVN
jgi:hypothetical protein